MALSTPFPEGFRGIGPLGNEFGASSFTTIEATTMFNRILSITIGVMTAIAGIWFIFGFLAGAIQWLSAGGDKQATQAAAKKLTHSIVGLFIVVVSYGLIIAIGNVLGINILNIGTIIYLYLHP